MTIGHDNAANLLGALSSLMRAGRTAAHRHANELGAAGTSIGVLKALREGDARPSDLAGRLHVGAPVVSRAVASLERDGLLVRTPDPKDARACLLSLSHLGRERLDAVQAVYIERVRDRLADWTDDDALVATKIIAALEQSLGESDSFASAQDITRSLIPSPTHEPTRPELARLDDPSLVAPHG